MCEDGDRDHSSDKDEKSLDNMENVFDSLIEIIHESHDDGGRMPLQRKRVSSRIYGKSIGGEYWSKQQGKVKQQRLGPRINFKKRIQANDRVAIEARRYINNAH